MRFLLRFFSLICLAVATIAGTIDSIQSVAASSVVVTSFGDGWKSLNPASFDKLQSAILLGAGHQYYAPVVEWIVVQPAFAIFLALSLLTWMIAHRRVIPARGFAA